jgi:hypothetical protein
MRTIQALITSGIAEQVTNAHQKFIEIKTERRTYVLQEGEQEKYHITIVRNIDEQIYEHKGPFEYSDGLGNLMLCVLAEEGIAL